MATTRSALTEADIRTLVKGASADERAWLQNVIGALAADHPETVP